MHTDLDRPSGAIGEALRRLRTEEAPPYDWQEYRKRSRDSQRPRRIVDWRHAAVAAALALVVGGAAAWFSIEKATPGAAASTALQINTSPTGTQTRLGGDRPVPISQPAGGVQTDVDPLVVQASIARSRALEEWLASLPREPAVVRVGTRAAVAGLEDQIAQVDDMLTSARLAGTRPDRLETLQRERVRLVGSLVQVRYAEVVASGSP
jgi:hypothetical protein